MRTSERTLIARLGFADADRKHPLHDIACQYLMQDTVSYALVRRFVPDETEWMGNPEAPYRKVLTDFGWYRQIPEYSVKTRNGRLVGFADLVIPYRAQWKQVFRDGEERAHWQPDKGNLLVEIKVSPCPVSEIIRQLKTYEQYLEGESGLLYQTEDFIYVAVTAFDLSVADVEMLRAAEICHLRLGQSFEDYARQRKDSTEVAESDEI